MNKIKVFSMFTGYGGAEWGLIKAGIPFEVVGFSEIDKNAIKFYKHHFPNHLNFGDATKIDPGSIPDFDLLTGGFPCQAFSIAGKRKGMEDTRGTLFYHIARIAKVKKPKYMLLENVKGLLNHDNGSTFKTILKTFKQLGYGVAYKILNSKDYGIPQNRERIWLVCKLGGWDFLEFLFPEPINNGVSVRDLLEDNVDKKFLMKFDNVEKIKKSIFEKYGINNPSFLIGDYRFDEGFRIRKDEASPTITAKSDGGMAHDVIIHSLQTRNADRPSLKYSSGGSGHIMRTDGTSYCLDTGMSQCVQIKNVWRKLTPRECFRLMGFLEDEVDLSIVTPNQAYKLAGNGWDINMAALIFKRIFKGGGF